MKAGLSSRLVTTSGTWGRCARWFLLHPLQYYKIRVWQFSSYVKHQSTGPSQPRTEKGEVKARYKNTETDTSEDRKEGSPAVENMSSKRTQIKDQGAIALYVNWIWISKGRERKSELIDDNLRCHIWHLGNWERMKRGISRANFPDTNNMPF